MEGELRHALAANVRAVRRAQNLTQEAFAEVHGLQRTWVGAIERGERNLTLRSLERLAERLGVPPLALLQPASPQTAPESPGAVEPAKEPRHRAEGGVEGERGPPG